MYNKSDSAFVSLQLPLHFLVLSLAKEMAPLWQTELYAPVKREDLVTVCITSITAVPMPMMPV